MKSHRLDEDNTVVQTLNKLKYGQTMWPEVLCMLNPNLPYMCMRIHLPLHLSLSQCKITLNKNSFFHFSFQRVHLKTWRKDEQVRGKERGNQFAFSLQMKTRKVKRRESDVLTLSLEYRDETLMLHSSVTCVALPMS